MISPIARVSQFALAVNRSLQSLRVKQLSYWKLMLRDGLNLYGAIWLVNMVNMLFWFIITPTGVEDPVRTIVTSMTAVLTASMSMRIVLSVRGSLAQGGSFAVTSSSHPSRSGNTTHVLSGQRPPANPVLSVGAGRGETGTFSVPLGGAGDKAIVGHEDWDGKSSVNGGRDQKPSDILGPIDTSVQDAQTGVRVTVESETNFDGYPKEKH